MALEWGVRIAFFASTVVPFHANTLNERPLGGTETGIIRLSNALQDLGHDVSVLVPQVEAAEPNALKFAPRSSLPRYLPHTIVESHPEVDAYISVRDWIPTMYKIPAKLRLFWTGDSYDQFSNFGVGDKRVHSGIDYLLTVSEWHSARMSEESGFPRHKAWVLGNGIHPPYFEGSEKKVRKRLIYSSTPHRGLKHIPRLFSAVRKKHPDAEMHIFSSYKVYDQDHERDYASVFAELEKMKNVKLHGSIKQSELAREFMKSAILFYPCDFEETSCITAMEAQAAGCAILSTKLAALPETVGDAGILIDGKPGSGNYDDAYIEAATRILSDDELFQKLSQRGLERSKTMGWVQVAERFTEFLKSQVK